VIFRRTGISGIWVIDPERREDARGWFSRTFCEEDFAEQGLAVRFAQCSASFNVRRGTLRGLHYQAAPHGEAKLIRCTRGRVFDVAVDLRPSSPTRGHWSAAELSAANGRMLYVPEGCAHGFQTLEDESEIFYQISVPHSPAHDRGVRWDDPAIGIEWPIADPVLSLRDAALPMIGETVC
jgi:dTDP-4-dehydrorhamnose 3,5-epimerase